jgi:hypothetical protein
MNDDVREIVSTGVGVASRDLNNRSEYCSNRAEIERYTVQYEHWKWSDHGRVTDQHVPLERPVTRRQLSAKLSLP